MSTTKYAFQPDYIVAPGATLKETLEVKGISQSDFAAHTGMAEKTISQIINGVAPITYETAERFELALGIQASFWNRREATYRAGLLRIEANRERESSISWLSELPIKHLLDCEIIKKTKDKAELVRQALSFFGVSSVNAWRKTWANVGVQFRNGDAAKNRLGYAATWLRLGELAAEKTQCGPFDANVFRQRHAEIRSYTRLPVSEWWNKLQITCAESGVVVALIPEVAGASISGATRWITPSKALIQLSLKYKTDDQFWFSFFHEAGHVLLHSKKPIFIEDGKRDSQEEREADGFARDLLIPKSVTGQFPLLKTRATIKAFAEQIGVSPGIVVGRLHHDGFLNQSYCTDLKVKYLWAKKKK